MEILTAPQCIVREKEAFIVFDRNFPYFFLLSRHTILYDVKIEKQQKKKLNSRTSWESFYRRMRSFPSSVTSQLLRFASCSLSSSTFFFHELKLCWVWWVFSHNIFFFYFIFSVLSSERLQVVRELLTSLRSFFSSSFSLCFSHTRFLSRVQFAFVHSGRRW